MVLIKCGECRNTNINNTSNVISTIMWKGLVEHKILSKYEYLNCKHKF